MAVSPPTGSRTRIAVLVVASVTLIAVGLRDVAVVRQVREGAASALDPIENGVDTVTSPVRNAWHGVTDYDEVKAENDRLRAEVADSRSRQVEGADARKQLADLSKVLDLPFAGSLPTVTARVVSGPRSNFSHAIEIDKGRKAGLAVGMPAATAAGLVGKVTQVTDSSATVQLITDPEFRVGVRLATTGALGTARGQGRDEALVVDSSINPQAKVRKGTGLTTSGIDQSTFPPGLPVGTVTSVRPGSGGLALELVVKPLVDVDTLSYLTVLRWDRK
jgi:rod shape-determining protein MreC